MVKVTETPEKLNAAKRNIKLEGILVDQLKFVDDTGDITQQVLNEIPKEVKQISFTIRIEIPSTDDAEE